MSANQPPVTPEQQIQQVISEVKNNTPIEIKLETGQVYKGANHQEVLDQVVKAQTEASRYIRQQKEQLQEAQSQIEALKQQQNRPPNTPDPQAETTEFWNKMVQDPKGTTKAQIAEALGTTPEQLPQLVAQLKQSYMANTINAASSEFQNRIPEYPNTREANAAMREGLIEKYGQARLLEASQDPDKLESTYHYLVREGRLNPRQIPPEQITTPTQTLPTIPGNSVPTQADTDMITEFRNMSLEDQRKTLQRLSEKGYIR